MKELNDEKIEKVVNNLKDDSSEELINLLKEKNIKNGVITLAILGIGTHTEYYKVLCNRINNYDGDITDDVVKKLAIDIFHEIDKEDGYDEDDEDEDYGEEK